MKIIRNELSYHVLMDNYIIQTVLKNKEAIISQKMQ